MNIKRYTKILLAVMLIFCLIFIFIFFMLLFPLKYRQEIVTNAKDFGVNTELVASVINVESSFNKNATSAAGAVGLMQLMPTTAEWLCGKLKIEYDYNILFDPAVNIKLGTYCLKYLIDKVDVFETAICAYNAGEGVVISWLNDQRYSQDKKTLKTVPYKETSEYLIRIKQSMRIYKYRF